ncbi:MAG: UDP-N-acetylmuramoyl-L-alanyl-D-glutamate--2,6-diaminopimelate ligase [Pontiellaceae bacterium]|nr:UDP-N-acetylmuramoyl-L-alanyl-D-glutamate--2,6-diaminopimelate ligase [Pontiellaceae bacterium]MBN2785209.1 UDP-N-acetylmuramoyl-L-alanyl-D-glutamate--2,6-diaminopimelate ligase [Pontiellaceae bacterium]
MKLKELLEFITTLEVYGNTGVEIAGITQDSRQVKPGFLFVAVPGVHTDGAEFVVDALSKGAVAVVSEAHLDLGHDSAFVRVGSARRALAELSCALFGHVTDQMDVIGVTGTNGKTTTTYMIRNILRENGIEAGLLGTVAYEIGNRTIPAWRTTPEAPELHSFLRQMLDHGCRSAVMEVSSHSIALERVFGIHFKIGVFTNLTQDHLDFHNSMEEYFEAKARMFDWMERMAGHSAVINVDDPWGQRLTEAHAPESAVVTYGFGEQAQVRALKMKLGVHGTVFKVVSPWGKARVNLKLLGRFNVHNALAALAVGGLMGVPFDRIVHSLSSLKTVPGRLELVPNRRGLRIFVDYAHTDDALKNVLSTLREICKGRLIVVFGCGGDRDRGKRKKMGAVASELADYSIITSDNPRSEEPALIATDILVGYDDPAKYEVILDRRDAIRRGIEIMHRRDLLLVAGKGHETYQESRGSIVPFDDREVVREIVG